LKQSHSIPKLTSNHIHKPQCGNEETGGGEAEGSRVQQRAAAEVPNVECGDGERGDWCRSSSVESGSEETNGDFRVFG
jgi:hypothetical protein